MRSRWSILVVLVSLVMATVVFAKPAATVNWTTGPTFGKLKITGDGNVKFEDGWTIKGDGKVTIYRTGGDAVSEGVLKIQAGNTWGFTWTTNVGGNCTVVVTWTVTDGKQDITYGSPVKSGIVTE